MNNPEKVESRAAMTYRSMSLTRQPFITDMRVPRISRFESLAKDSVTAQNTTQGHEFGSSA